MIKTGISAKNSLEDSKITDSKTGKRIYITVATRKAFRAVNPEWAHVRNSVLNSAIGADFSRAEPQKRPFKPRGEENAVGQARGGANGTYIAIITSSYIKIVTVMRGAPRLPPPPPEQTDGTAPGGGLIDKFKSLFTSTDEAFFNSHRKTAMAEKFKAKEASIMDLVQALSEITGLTEKEVLSKLEEDKYKNLVTDLLQNSSEDIAVPVEDHGMGIPDHRSIQVSTFGREPVSSQPSAPFAVPVGVLAP